MLPKVVLNNVKDDSNALRFFFFFLIQRIFIHKSVNFLDLQVGEYVVHF